jgi:sialate O-acetylesterase
MKMPDRIMQTAAVAALLYAFAPPSLAGATSEIPAILLHKTFQDHAVLQRGQPIPVWGTAPPGAKVTVTLGNKTVSAKADPSGRWQAKLPPLPAGGPFTLTARGSDGAVQTAGDILIGDVFLCSGQSNMEMPVNVASNYGADIGGATNTGIRLFHVQRFPSPAPQDDFGAGATWAVTSPAAVTDFSAACYNFGKNLQPAVNVPVGLIEDAWGGSIIEAWLSAGNVRELGGRDFLLDMLKAYAASPRDAESKWRDYARDWWKTHDPASAGTPAWSDPATDDLTWNKIVPTGTWRAWNAPPLDSFNGIVWLREKVELTADQAKSAAVLSLGAIDRADIAFVNGVPVGAGQGYDVPRNYDIPAGTLHAGSNLIAVGVQGGAGMLSPAGQMTLNPKGGAPVKLDAPWRYKLSAPMDKTGVVADMPWLNQFGLTVLYNGMIRPLGETKIRAAIWYQGESNVGSRQEYARMLPAMIGEWRKQFGAGMPFIVVQLPNFGPFGAGAEESGWAEMREVQRTVVSRTPNTALVTTIDIGQPDNIHPTNKQEVGRRIALAAEKLVYGMNIAATGPTPRDAVRNDDAIAVRFDHIENGLIVYASNRPIGFQLCDANRQCRYVDATQRGNEIDLDAARIPAAVSVRYCWADSPICNVYNSAGLPAVPFEMEIK